MQWLGCTSIGESNLTMALWVLRAGCRECIKNSLKIKWLEKGSKGEIRITRRREENCYD